ncbi:MFS transporter [Amylibacter marinus]|uniref:MFS transporter n=1 Tax=Amylibacter marinus TaxID=1475483 RepID=A0ABQ5VX69_9RHOB|nr:class I SAM-dependent methyltransferase [Amylibacter marinus]GLQ35887.1 MFS transporter [Amylibacter marinus]
MTHDIRLSLALDQISAPIENALVLNAQPHKYPDLPSPHCQQSFRPYCDQLSALGLHCGEDLPRGQDIAVVEITRFKPQTQALIARAIDHVAQGGLILVNGAKTDGIESHLKNLRKLLEIDGVVSKAHGKAFWFTRTGTENPVAQWQDTLIPSKNKDGFMTQAGVFSANHIDPASRLLVDNLPKTLAGRGADLGAGWGYLSTKILAQYPKILGLDLVEADLNALDCARLNVTDTRASFHWQDATEFKTPPLDFVVMNPPFHNSRLADPEIGRAFIQRAAQLLKPKGQLWMVANRQLAYESTLEACFINSQILQETPQFKVIRADRPQKPKAQRAQ